MKQFFGLEPLPQNELDRIAAAQTEKRTDLVLDQLQGQDAEGQRRAERDRLIKQNPTMYNEIDGLFKKGEPLDIIQTVVSAKASSTAVAPGEAPMRKNPTIGPGTRKLTFLDKARDLKDNPAQMVPFLGGA
ncbi:MAG TPA: hypothetical protein VLH39_05355, partial [Magnetospirillaceae bacterium]|nr:hypothetical protein [Magnetospirillaceae bacterium]